MADPPSSNPDGLCDLDEAGLRTRVERTLALIRPAIRADGGDVELVSAAPDGLVRIRLLGACIGCPSASMTLHHGIERALRSDLGPSIRVEAVGGRAGG